MKYLVLIVLLFSFSSGAANCVYIDASGTLKSSATPIATCNDLVLLSKAEYEAISLETIISTLKDLFEFSVEDFALFNSICLIAFITGHSIGRVSRILGKT